MEIKLLNVLDFFYFRKEFKSIMDLNFLSYMKFVFVDNYLFYLKNTNGTIALLKASKNDELKFNVSDIYELDKPLLEMKEKENYDSHSFLYSSTKQDELVSKVGFKKTSMDEFMVLNVNDVDFKKFSYSIKFNYESLTRSINEDIRCEIQNNAFKSEKRFPLKSKDVKYEMSRRNYIPELAYFIKRKFDYVGYGQILLMDGKYTVVNLCVKTECQGQGIGTELLKFLLVEAKKLDINEVFIKVKSNNIAAKKLYLNLGFKIIEKTTFFEM